MVVGPSGCGKSTLLRLIAGLEMPTAGRVSIGERDVTEVEPAARGVAMVFQSYALYPHLTVAQNIAFPLRMARLPKAEIAAKVAEVSRLLELETLLDRRPRELSGGQRQRVSIGRVMPAFPTSSSSRPRSRRSVWLAQRSPPSVMTASVYSRAWMKT